MNESESLKQKTARGILWGTVGNGLMQLLNLAFGLFLANILSRADYGVVGMLSIFTALVSSLQEGGLIAALTNKKEARPEDYNAVFWFSFLCSLVCYAILFLCAPLIAAHFHTPELLRLSRYAFLGFVIASLSAAPCAYMFRNLMVKQRALVMSLGLLCSGIVGVTLALLGFAYWALVAQNLTFVSFTCIGYWWHTPWRPTLRIDLRPLRGMFSFSCRLVLTNLFNVLNNNLLTYVLARHYHKEDVGLYTQASKWTTMGFSTLNGMITSVAQPVLVQVRHDRERQRRVFHKMLRLAAFVSFPGMWGLGLISEELIYITVGTKWLPSVPFMQLLCLSSAFLPLTALYGNLANSEGRSDIYMWNTICLGLSQLLCAFLLYPYGIMPMLVGYAALSILWTFVWHFTAGRLIGISLSDALRDMIPYQLLTLVALGIAWWAACRIESPYLSLPVKVLTAAAVYALLLWKLNSTLFRESLQFLLRKKQPSETAS